MGFDSHGDALDRSFGSFLAPFHGFEEFSDVVFCCFAGNLLLLKEVQLITFAPFAIVISVTASKRKKENGT